MTFFSASHPITVNEFGHTAEKIGIGQPNLKFLLLNTQDICAAPIKKMEIMRSDMKAGIR